ncbi:hypothetical protein LOC67_02750 [Stieleria sp. JC731]|uniref:tetratricopeptide repeat protein n=1 Tax=Pirellulaceae TaxID=2691357 RepID=UPI001E3771AD|nr:tetratricopeptide repeat protein [Stieleria sp. JC731]MCC9599465.1 hypothetical protein [Stieleria sp. JC731]
MLQRAKRNGRKLISAMMVAALLAAPAGCSLSRSANRSVVKAASKRDTAKAKRLTNSGIRSLNHEHRDLAAKHFRDAIEADYAYGPAHNNLGLMHYQQGNLYQAVMAFEEARQFLPQDATVVYNLALALESGGRVDEALDLYYTANHMAPANPHYLGNLVRLRIRRGERDEVLMQQLQDLALIETRPEWRRWADEQLALTLNDALDRGPSRDDIASSLDRDDRPPEEFDLERKIIDLTPVMPVAHQEPAESIIGPAAETLELNSPQEPPSEIESSSSPMLKDEVIDDLSEEAYFEQ